MPAPIRSVSLKSSHRQPNKLLLKIRRNTWTCHKHRRYTVSPRVSRWVSQHNKRQTMATISTLANTNSETTTLNHIDNYGDNIFHTQSLLFLFGFLFFPCWWIGGYYLKIEVRDIESITVHPSMLANGKTCSRLIWLSNGKDEMNEMNEIQLFYRWNRCMSFVSIGLIFIMTSLMIWYYISFYYK